MVPNHSIHPYSSLESPSSPSHPSSSSLLPSTPNKHHQTLSASSTVHLSQLLPFPSSNTTNAALVNMNINNHNNNNNSKNNVYTNHGHSSNKIWKASLITNISSSGNHLVSLAEIPDCRKNE